MQNLSHMPLSFGSSLWYNNKNNKGVPRVEISYYVIDAASGAHVPAQIRLATQEDFQRTVREEWQTSWLSGFIQDMALEKYALEITGTKELVGLGAYRDVPDGLLVYVEYIESAPSSNPTIKRDRKYRGIGAALLAYGVQLSVDYGYGGAIYLKAKTTEIWEHYIRDYGAEPFSRVDPYLLLLEGDAARRLFSQFLKEE